MNATDARRLASARNAEVARAKEIIEGKKHVEIRKTFEQQLAHAIGVYDRQIESAAKAGLGEIDFESHDESLDKPLREHYAAKGFHFHTHREDHGYCIGYIHTDTMSW